MAEAETSDSRTSASASVASITGPSSEHEAPSAPLLLSRLRCPQPAISRKWKVALNSPPRGKRRSAGHGNFDPKSVTPSQEFLNEQLSVSAGKLF